MALVVASVLPLLAFTLWLQYANYRDNRGAFGERALSQARSAALVVERELQARIAALQVLALAGVLQAGDLVAFRARAEAVVAELFPGANILLLDQNGQHLINLAVPPGQPLPKRQELETLRAVFATGRPVVSDLFQGVVLKRPIVSIEVPVKRGDGSVAYLLALNPPLSNFAEVIHGQRLPPGWVVSVFDRNGVNVARTPNPERFVGQKASVSLLPHLLSRQEGVIESVSLEGILLLSAFSRSELYGWSVGIGIPRAELTGPAFDTAITALWIGIGLLIFGLLLAFTAARQISGPIALLGQIASDLELEASTQQPRTGLPETDHVAEALLAAERNRRNTERQLRLFIEVAPAAIAMFDKQMRYLAVSRRFRDDYRLGEEPVVGRSHYDVFPEVTEHWRDVHRRCLAGATERKEAEAFPRSNGKIDWVRWEIRPWYDDDAIGGIVLFSEVITEQIQAQEELRQAQRLETLSQLTGGVAHDFNNILTVISGSAELLGDQVSDRADLKNYVRMIDAAADRGAALTQHLLAFARRQVLEPVETDVNGLVAETLKLLRPTLGEHIEIEGRLAASLPTALIDPSQLTTVGSPGTELEFAL